MEGNSEPANCKFFNDILESDGDVQRGGDGVFKLAQINCQSKRNKVQGFSVSITLTFFTFLLMKKGNNTLRMIMIDA